jgi:hypothetical protein
MCEASTAKLRGLAYGNNRERGYPPRSGGCILMARQEWRDLERARQSADPPRLRKWIYSSNVGISASELAGVNPGDLQRAAY